MEAQPVVALARDAQRVDRLADAPRRADAARAVLLERLHVLAADVLVGGPGAAVAAGERRERLRGGVVHAGGVRQQVEAAQHQARPLGVRDGGRGPHVAVEGEQRDDGDAGQKGYRPERPHQTPLRPGHRRDSRPRV